MRIENLRMPPFNTTLLGVVKGVLDHYGIEMSPAMAFGASGHAFLINIHDELCPSGPYCWKYGWFYRLLVNLGLEIVDLGLFEKSNTPEQRAGVERKVRDFVAGGTACSMQNMENQLITGYDDKVFFTFQPWGDKCGGFPPATLTYGTWQELGDEVHVNFFAFNKSARPDERKALRDSLECAVDMFRHPEKYNWPRYGIGPAAYDNWLKAVAAGHGSEHGNWWNAAVWSECRSMASAYFAEIAGRFPKAAAQAQALAAAYREIAALLAKAADKAMPAEEKSRLLTDLKGKELEAITGVQGLLRSL